MGVFPEKIALEQNFKGKWKFPEARRRWGEYVNKSIGLLQWNFQILYQEAPDLGRTDSSSRCKHVYERTLQNDLNDPPPKETTQNKSNLTVGTFGHLKSTAGVGFGRTR